MGRKRFDVSVNLISVRLAGVRQARRLCAAGVGREDDAGCLYRGDGARQRGWAAGENGKVKNRLHTRFRSKFGAIAGFKGLNWDPRCFPAY